MKKTLIIIILFLFALSDINAQLYIIYTKISCDATYDSNLSKWNPWANFSETELTIRIDLDKSTVKIANKAEDAFKLLKLYEKSNGTDPEFFDQNYTLYVYIAVDKKGNDCTVQLKYFDKKDDVSLVGVRVSYPTYMFSYLGSIVEF